MPKKRKRKYPTTVVAWDRRGGAIGGIVTFDPKYLEEVLAAFYEEDEAVIDDYGDEPRVKLGFYISPSDSDNVDYFGSIQVIEPEEEDTSRKSKRSSSSRRRR